MKYVDKWIEIALLKWRIWNCCCFVVVVMFMLDSLKVLYLFVWLCHFKGLFRPVWREFTGRKFYRWSRDNWPIGQWEIFHIAPDTSYVNQFFSRVNLWRVIQFHSGETSRPRVFVNVTWFLRGETNDKSCQCKKSGSSLFTLDKRKHRIFHNKDDYGKLWVEVIIVTSLDAVVTVDRCPPHYKPN